MWKKFKICIFFAKDFGVIGRLEDLRRISSVIKKWILGTQDKGSGQIVIQQWYFVKMIKFRFLKSIDFSSLQYILYRSAVKSLARPTYRCTLMVRIFCLMVVLLYIYIIYIYSTNIPPIMIIHRVRKRFALFFIFFSRCPVCGEWCKLH